ncbi:MAG: nitroreductase family protein [Haliscomenobacter sp.]|uniref:iodotyrosine deiodinase n=1 Tax=Haliscomenobacter sp. TaxID=2717303 RepID=UPI0029A16118|nr:iodotyrosine deiodinase [Haliscomenobacter sp.]MDX2072419.1 nitroreductase family protein [Haliscomenobacter sp.]
MKGNLMEETPFSFVPYQGTQFEPAEMLKRSEAYYQWMNQRRTLREFSDRPVPLAVIENIVMTASTAPSGAHKQPWTFAVVADPAIKAKIRQAAEQEEYENYHGRMSEEWLDDLLPFATDWHKPFLELAPYLIVVFRKAYDLLPDGTQRKNYYVQESVGIACGMLLAAIHHAGLVALTHTPSPMNFLQNILQRPENERPFLLIPVGYPADGALVPNLQRKEKADVITIY